MRAHTAFRRIVLTLVALALLAGQPRDAWAAKEQDWWGWLEEFSGPGPFKGWELSLEVLCINLAQREEVPKEAYKDLFDALKNARTAVSKTAASVLAERSLPMELSENIKRIQNVDSADFNLNGPMLATKVLESQEALGRDNALNLGRAALEVLRLRSQTSSFLALGVDAAGKSQVKTTRDFSSPRANRWQLAASCREAQRVVDTQRKQEEKRIAAYAGTGQGPVDDKGNDADKGSAEDKERFVIDRRDWQTGIVINFGSYQSLENKLFDPNGIAEDEPQVRLRPFEVLAHSKVSSSIDIGAGIGFARITTEGSPGTIDKYPTFDPENADSKVFYLVPLSVVVRPGRLFTNSRWASIVGYRMSLRYFGDLDTANFAVRPPPTPQSPAYKQSGEFVWGAALFVDLVSAFEFAFNPKGR